MDSYQARVIGEMEDLEDRRERLMAFFGTDLFKKLDQAEKDRLRTQHMVMGVYSNILRQRIEAFTK